MGMTTITPESQDRIGDEGLARIREAVKFLGICRSKIYYMMDAGSLPYCRIGRARRIPWRAIRQLAENSLVLR
jgi:excisionase family DNA binding protein